MKLFGKKGKYKNEHELVNKALVSKSARDELRRHSRDLCVKVAEKYKGGYSKTFLANEGMKYFDRAFTHYTKHFIDGKKYKFTTYYTWWIRQAITEFINKQE